MPPTTENMSWRKRVFISPLSPGQDPGPSTSSSDGSNRGRTPATINDVELSQKHLELRLKDYQPYVQELQWPANGTIQLDVPLKR